LLPDLTLPAAGAVLSAAFLAFYAFIGFEDMVNMAEEVKHPKRTLPRAILLAMIITTALYILVALIAVLSVPTDDLAAAEAPLSLLLGGIAGPRAIILISMLAGVNGALVQIVMASRVMYGMATRRGAPRWLGAVHPATQTPVRATIVAALVVALLAWWLPLESLARITSAIILGVFALVHASLIRIRFRAHHRPGGLPRTLIPVAGLASCFVMLAAAAARLF
jgi:amino acid transporter